MDLLHVYSARHKDGKGAGRQRGELRGKDDMSRNEFRTRW